MFQRIINSKAWHDPVGSKLISDAIRFLVVSFGTLVIAYWYLGKEYIYFWVQGNWQSIVILFLIVINLALWRKSRILNNKLQTPTVKTGLDWLLSLSDDELFYYDALMWFPINNTLQVKIRLPEDNVEYIPLFRQLLDHKILTKIKDGYEIDYDVFKYFEGKTKLLSEQDRYEYLGSDDDQRVDEAFTGVFKGR